MAPPGRRRLVILLRLMMGALVSLATCQAFLGFSYSSQRIATPGSTALRMHQLQPLLNTPLRFGCGSRRVLRLFAGEKGGDEDALIGDIATLEELEAAIQTSGTTKPLVLRFHASWCSACKRFAPTWQQTVNAYEEYFDFVDVDVTGKRDIIMAMGLTVLPHSHFYVGGSKVEDFGVSIKKLNGLLERLDKYKKMQ